MIVKYLRRVTTASDRVLVVFGLPILSAARLRMATQSWKPTTT